MSWFFKEAQHAQLYRKYRVTYPTDLFNCILSNLGGISKVGGRWQTALDVGCGTGQSTLPLAGHFNKVIGIDPSEAQLNEAKQHAADAAANVEFRVGNAQDFSFQPSDSVDLITAAQAAHWFDLDVFFGEARRVLRTNGVLAMYGYGVPQVVKPDAYSIVMQLHDVQLNNYWDRGRDHIVNKYKDIFESLSKAFPASKRDDSLEVNNEYTVDEFVGYLKTWSAYQRYRQENADIDDPLIDIHKKFSKIYGSDGGTAEKIHVKFPLFILLATNADRSCSR